MDVMEKVSRIGIVPVVAIDDADKAVGLAKALIAGGLPVAEITFRTAAAEDAIKAIVAECPEMIVGAGTVLNVEQAKRAIAAGASFIVSPGLNEAIVEFCAAEKMPCLPGCSNPSEMMRAVNLGCKVVKFFPAENLGGIAFLNAVAPTVPLKFMPTGGVNVKNLADYASSERIFAMGGTWMVKKDLIEAENWAEITRLCKEAVHVMLGFQVVHIGINCGGAADAKKSALQFADVFGFSTRETSLSTFAGTGIECMNDGRGHCGHIAVATNCLDRAEYHLSKSGVHFDETSRKVDAKTGRTKLLYIKDEIAGFAVHLLQK